MINKKFLTNCLMLGAFAVSSLFIGGCKDTNGGGFIVKSDGEKATFGFQLKCSTDADGNCAVSGQLQYNDHGAKVNFHAVPDSVPTATCTDAVLAANDIDLTTLPIELSAARYSGTYTPHPQKKGQEGGRFDVVMVDGGGTGKDKGDTFAITLTGGIYNGYTASGFLQGGNVNVK